MPQKKKVAPKKSNVVRSNKVSAKYKFKPWHAVAGLALFIAGGFVVAYSQASSETAALQKAQPLIQYEYSEGPAVTEIINGTPTLQQGPKTVQLTQDGNLYCFEQNADAGTNRKLNANEITILLSELKAAQPVQLPSATSETPTVAAKVISYQDPATKKLIAIDLSGNNINQPGAVKVATALEKACKTNAKPTKRKDTPNPGTRKSTPTSFNVIQRTLVGVAQASADANAKVQYNNEVSFHMVALVNAARRNAGLPEYGITSCLNNSAKSHSDTFASAFNSGTSVYPYIWHSNIIDPINKACGNVYRTMGENVAWYHGAANGVSSKTAAEEMFNLYMNSPSHRAAILDTTKGYREFGTGSSSSGDRTKIFNTQHFGRR